MISTALARPESIEDDRARPDEPLWRFVERSGLRSVVVGPSKDPNAKVTILLVTEAGRAVYAVKVPTTDAAGAAVKRERNVLADLHESVRGDVRLTIPGPVESVDYDGRAAMVATAVRGTPMTMSYVSRRHRRSVSRVAADFTAVGAWLASLRSQSAAGSGPLELDCGVTQRLRERFADDPQIDSDAERVADVHAALRAETALLAAVHGDLWFGNLLLADGRVTGVVDWEYGEVSGQPARDLGRFALMYALYLGGPAQPQRRVSGHPGIRTGTWGAAVEYALDGTGWFPDLFGDFLRRGLAALGASPTLWRHLALAGIAETAALTDHLDFARAHLALFRRCARLHPGGTRRT